MKPILNLGDKFQYVDFGTTIYQVIGVNVFSSGILYNIRVISSPRLNEAGKEYYNQNIGCTIIKISNKNHPLTSIFK